MELDEMQQKWAEYDRKLEMSLRLSRQVLNTIQLKRARSALQPLIVSLSLEAALTLAAVMVLGGFIYDHFAQPRFALPAVCLDLYAIAIVAGLLRQIVAACQINYDFPVVVIQRQMEALRMLRGRCVQRTLLTMTLAWPPLLIVALKGAFGIDAYRCFGAAWLIANVLFGLAVIPLALWLAKRFGRRFSRFPFVQRLVDDLMGHSLKTAAGFLATLSEFETERPD